MLLLTKPSPQPSFIFSNYPFFMIPSPILSLAANTKKKTHRTKLLAVYTTLAANSALLRTGAMPVNRYWGHISYSQPHPTPHLPTH